MHIEECVLAILASYINLQDYKQGTQILNLIEKPSFYLHFAKHFIKILKIYKQILIFNFKFVVLLSKQKEI